MSVVKTGYVYKGVVKGVTSVKSGVFKKSQMDFLLTLFNNSGGPKIRERDTQLKMVVTQFKDKDADSDLSLCLVLSKTQFKSWFSSETMNRQKMVVNRVIEKGLTELSESIDTG